VLALAGCGGGSKHASPACEAQATRVAEHAGSIVVHFRGGTVYPADMALLGLNGSLQGFVRLGCPTRTLGSTLQRRLTPADRKTLLSLLPRETARVIRHALAAVR
jgi:hypothetical protein